MQYEIDEVDPVFENQYYIQKETIDLGELPNGSETTIITALQNQNKQADLIMAKKGKRPVYYYGTAHMPLICALGHRYGGNIGQQHYLHRENRQAGNTVFTELKAQNSNDNYDFTSVTFSQELQSKQLVLAIGVSGIIDTVQLQHLLPGKHLLHIQCGNPNRDFFLSQDKMRQFIKSVLEELEVRVKEHGIKTIHVALAAPVPFCFELGKALHENIFGDIIVYHYDRKSDVCFPWGIMLSANLDEAYVQLSE